VRGEKWKKKWTLFERSEFRPLPIFCFAQTGTPQGLRLRGRLLLLTFLGETRKVSGCRAAPGNALLHEEQTASKPTNQNQTSNKKSAPQGAFLNTAKTKSLQSHNPANQSPRFRFTNLCISRHRHSTPGTAATLQHFLHEFIFRAFLAGVFSRNIFKRRTHHLVCHRMTSHAIFCFGKIGIRHRDIRHASSQNQTQQQSTFHAFLHKIDRRYSTAFQECNALH